MNNSTKNWILNTIFGILVVALTILLYKKILIATIALTILAIIYLLIWKSKIMWKIFIFASIFGALSEIITTHYGLWEYALPNLLDIPFWLIPLWGCAGIFIYRLRLNFKANKK